MARARFVERQQVFLLAQDPSLCTLRVRLAVECVSDILHWALPDRTDVQFVRWCWRVAAARTFSGRAGRLGTVLLHMLVLFCSVWAIFGALCGPSWSRPGTKLVLSKANFWVHHSSMSSSSNHALQMLYPGSWSCRAASRRLFQRFCKSCSGFAGSSM